MAKIAYTNKVTASTIAAAEINKITAANMNEIKTSVNVNVDDIAAEIINRANADTTLQTNINNVETDLESQIQAEQTRATTAESTLQNNIDAVDTTLSDTIAVETAARIAADNLKANIANPTFTGTVSGITKAMVGLGNVDNTSDASKPVSTAQATALAIKLDKGTFVGNAKDLKDLISANTNRLEDVDLEDIRPDFREADNTLQIAINTLKQAMYIAETHKQFRYAFRVLEDGGTVESLECVNF